jgi:hypothetical protein
VLAAADRALNVLAVVQPDQLRDRRYRKFRRIGAPAP